MYSIEKEVHKLVYFTLIAGCARARARVRGCRSCNNYVSVNITSEEKKPL